MIETQDIMVPGATGEEKRKAYYYLPETYEKDPGRRYAVLYMFDGHNVFFDSHATYGKSWGMGEYLSGTGTDLIVAAIECSHSPDNGRLSEYSPWNFVLPPLVKITGRGELTMDWIINTWKPMVDDRYRTIPDRTYTMIAGSSMGGLMSLYAVIRHNDVFGRAAALSPSVSFSCEKIQNLIRKADLDPDTVLYMDYGEEELKTHRGMRQALSRTVKNLMERQVLLNFRIVPGGTHCEASWERQIPFFINTLLYER